jgi:hypothetical protein
MARVRGEGGRIVFPRIVSAQQGESAGRRGCRAPEILEFAETNHVFDGIAAATGMAVRYNRGDGTDPMIALRYE